MNEKEKRALEIANACIDTAKEISEALNKRTRRAKIDFEFYSDYNGAYLLPTVYAFRYDGGFTLRFNLLFWDLEIAFVR